MPKPEFCHVYCKDTGICSLRFTSAQILSQLTDIEKYIGQVPIIDFFKSVSYPAGLAMDVLNTVSSKIPDYAVAMSRRQDAEPTCQAHKSIRKSPQEVARLQKESICVGPTDLIQAVGRPLSSLYANLYDAIQEAKTQAEQANTRQGSIAAGVTL